MHNDQALINAAFDAGVVGYVFKARLSMDLVPAVDAVLSGNTFRVRSGVIENNTERKLDPIYLLLPRESMISKRSATTRLSQTGWIH
jgi:DNA-binding NarL/FixJ family response regulator